MLLIIFYISYKNGVKIFLLWFINNCPKTTVHPGCSGHSTSISACEVWGDNGRGSSLRKETLLIYLDYVRVEFLSCIKKKNLP